MIVLENQKHIIIEKNYSNVDPYKHSLIWIDWQFITYFHFTIMHHLIISVVHLNTMIRNP